MLGCTSKGVDAYMIIEPKKDEVFIDDLNRTWVSNEWLRKQTVTNSTEGWHEAVVERIKGRMTTRKGAEPKVMKGKVWYKLKSVLEAFDNVVNY